MRPVFVLTLICVIAAALLAGANHVTKNPIIEAKNRLKMEALGEIFPFEIKNVKTIKDGNTIYYEIPSADNKLRGVGIETFTDKGYGGHIDVLLGVSPAGEIYDYKVIFSKETPGLGSKLSNTEFRRQFKGKSLTDRFKWKVKKDAGDVDEITAATISSRAIVDALTRGLNLFSKKYLKGHK
jgi:electron transport complex protein RnfG